MKSNGNIRAKGIALLAADAPALAADLPDAKIVYKNIPGALTHGVGSERRAGGETELRLHVFKPQAWSPEDKRPAIVFFFGGGWNGGTPEQFYPHSRYFAARGMVAVAAEYRVESRHKTTPFECVKDGKSAIRWVRQNAKSLGVNPKRIAAGGGSAGAHVAAAAGTVKGLDEEGEDTNTSARPDALVLFNPVYDNGPGGYGHERVKERWREISPMHNIDKDTPPAVVMLGTKDRLIPVTTAEKFKALMEKAGVRSDLHLHEGQGHGFFNHRDGKNRFYHLTVIEADRFLASLGYIKGEPTLEAPPDEKTR